MTTYLINNMLPDRNYAATKYPEMESSILYHLNVDMSNINFRPLVWGTIKEKLFGNAGTHANVNVLDRLIEHDDLRS